MMVSNSKLIQQIFMNRTDGVEGKIPHVFWVYLPTRVVDPVPDRIYQINREC